MKRYYKPSGIATWYKDDRPREKLFRNGVKHLSDSELLIEEFKKNEVLFCC